MNGNPSTNSPADRLQQIVQHFQTRSSSQKLSQKVCILTGVGNQQSIGWATAILFAKENASHLYLFDLNGEALPTLSKLITKINPGTKVTTFQGDATDEKFIQSICERAIQEHGHLDVFFANAGIGTGAPLKATAYKTAERTLKINTLSCWLALKYASEAMLKNTSEFKGGSIILTSSVAGIRSGAGSADYSASKAAVLSLALTGANANPGSNIRVNSINPGLIQTQMAEPVFRLARDKSKIGQLCPLRRYGLADEVAGVVLFLAGNDSSYVNGAIIPVDGGLSSSLPVIPGKLH